MAENQLTTLIRGEENTFAISPIKKKFFDKGRKEILQNFSRKPVKYPGMRGNENLRHYGREPFEYLGMRRKEHLRQYGQVSGEPVKHCEEIIFFTDTDRDEETNPKFVLVAGTAGIGKKKFCQKLIGDWADNKRFQTQTVLISDVKQVLAFPITGLRPC